MPHCGLSLIEMLAVVAIMSAIAGVAVVAFGGLEERQVRSVAVAEMQALAGAVNAFHADTGRAPFTLDELLTRPAAVPAYSLVGRHGWRGPYCDWLAGRPARPALPLGP